VQQSDLVQRLLTVLAPSPAAAGTDGTPADDAPAARVPPASSACCYGFAMSLASTLVTSSQHDAELSGFLKGVEEWAAFTSPTGPLAEWCASQAKALGGKAPTQVPPRQ
jgi:hypothetical protein